jgi:hypothetical protein
MNYIQNLKGMNLSVFLLCLIFVAGLTISSKASAAMLIVYPAKGAAIGAAGGALGGALRGRQDLDAQHQAYDSAPTQQKAQLQTYDRAYSACLTGRGYTVE